MIFLSKKIGIVGSGSWDDEYDMIFDVALASHSPLSEI